jgi:hypothetical protein
MRLLGTYFLGKKYWENRWTASLHNQVYQEYLKYPIQIFDMKLLGSDFVEYQFVNTPGSARSART